MTLPFAPLPFATPSDPTAPIAPVSYSTTPVSRRDCQNCPSILRTDKQAAIIQNGLNAPICGLKMLPLVSSLQNEATQRRSMKNTASKCDQFGRETQFTPLNENTAPIMEIGYDVSAYRVPDSTDTTTGISNVASCETCANHVDPVTVLRKFGWTGSICRAKGALQISGWRRRREYARTCGSYVRKIQTEHVANLDQFELFPRFRADFGKATISGTYRQKISNIIDPSVYPHEREEPVTLEERARYIRAFRRLADPEGYGPDVFLPIYAAANWNQEQRVLVPKTGDKERPELYADHGGHLYSIAVSWLHLDETPAAWGPGGVGKTEIYRHLAWLMQLPFHRISITAEMTVDELAGKFVFEDGQTKFIYGLLPRAWGHPSVIDFDEPNTGQNEVWQIVRPLTDASKTLILSQNKNERIERGPDTFFGMSMNPNWDVLNVGTNVVGDADLSRLVHMFFDYPPEELEREIIRARVPEIDELLLASVMKATKDLRQIAQSGQIDSTWGVRHNIKVAKSLMFFSPEKAFKLAIGDALAPSQLEHVLSIVNAQFRTR